MVVPAHPKEKSVPGWLRDFLGIFFLLLPFSGLRAQSNYPRFRHFGNQDGLSTSAVTRIVQDKEGKIWIGTHDGLNCLYGDYFETFFQDRKTGKGLSQSAISDLTVDQNGLLWIATYGGGINRMDPISRQFLPLPPQLRSIPWKQANCVAEDPQGNIWMGFYEGLLVYRPSDGKVIRMEKVPGFSGGFPVLKLAFDRQGHAFAATPFQGLAVFSTQPIRLLERVPVQAFGSGGSGLEFFHQLISGKDHVVACSQAGLFELSLNSGRARVEKSQPEVNTECLAYLRDAQARTWVAFPTGKLEIHEKEARQIVPLAFDSRLFPGGRVNELFQDRWGGIWVGSTEGLSYSHPQLGKFPSWSFDDKRLTHCPKIVWSIFTEDDRHFLLGSESGLFRFDSQIGSLSSVSFPPAYVNAIVYSSIRTRSGRLLLGTSDGLFELKNQEPIHLCPAITGLVSTILELGDGSLLVGCYDEQGIYLLDRNLNLVRHFLHEKGKESLINNSINTLIKGEEGGVWIGTDLGLSGFFPKTGKFDNSLWERIQKGRNTSSLVYALLDLPDQFWIGTYGSGILMVDKRTLEVKEIGLAEGLPNESVYQLREVDGHVWASTNQGLCRILLPSFKVQVFTEGDGLQSREYNHYASFQNLESGRTYFGGLYGFDEVSRLSPPDNHIPPRMVLSSARLLTNTGNVRLPHPDSGSVWTLSHDRNNLELEFSALNYLMPEKNQYAYSLNHSSRISLGTKNKITLLNLRPGDYTLEIFGSNNDGIWSVKPLQIRFEIQAPLWQTLWFRALAVFSLGLLLFWIVRLYLRSRLREQTLALERMEAVRKERNRISAEMHDDLGAGITSIKMMTELLQLRYGNLPGPELEKIARRSDELVENLNTIVWALNDRNDRIDHMLAYFRSYIRSRFEEFPMAISIEMDLHPDTGTREINGENRRHLFLIVKESLHNLMKHSGATEVRVLLRADVKGLFIRIADNGVGFSGEDSVLGNGLKNLRERARALGGTIRFLNENGFVTELEVPLYNERVIAGEGKGSLI